MLVSSTRVLLQLGLCFLLCLFGSDAAKTTCPTGVYDTVTKCAKCPNGATCKDGKIETCGTKRHKIVTDSGHDCADCPTSAVSCDGNKVTCVSDELYEFGAFNNVIRCRKCPTGGTCNGQELVKCGDGTDQFRVGKYGQMGPGTHIGFQDCEKCPIGATCSNSFLKTCGAGKFRQYYAAPHCAACPTGATCDGDWYFKVNCGTGKVIALPQGHVKCVQCPTGATCDGTFPKCLNGKVQSTVTDECVDCPTGATCDDNSLLGVKCPTDQLLSQGTFQCMKCPKGYTCDGSPLMLHRIAPVLTSFAENDDMHINWGNTCEKGKPITDEETCKALAKKYLRYVLDMDLPYHPGGCFLRYLTTTDDGKHTQDGFFFNHNSGGGNGYKVCSLKETLLGAATSHEGVTFVVGIAVAVLLIQ